MTRVKTKTPTNHQMNDQDNVESNEASGLRLPWTPLQEPNQKASASGSCLDCQLNLLEPTTWQRPNCQSVYTRSRYDGRLRTRIENKGGLSWRCQETERRRLTLGSHQNLVVMRSRINLTTKVFYWKVRFCRGEPRGL
jgi:hypothetical protein